MRYLLSRVRRADLILVVDQGRIVEQGRHEVLLAKNGLYRKIYEFKFQGQEALRGGG